MKEPENSPQSKGLSSVGPAIIVACVVLGPGSILSNSKVGWQFGYEMIWVLAGAGLLMIGMTALSARLGVLLDGTPCEELSRRAGRGWAFVTGLCIFLICASFQFGNNLGVLFAVEPFLDGTALQDSRTFPVVVLLLLNGVVLFAMFGLRKLYRPVERLMKALVGVMLFGFAVNMLLARPSILSLLAGLLPQLPEQAAETLLPRMETDASGAGRVVDHLWPVQALIGTTFSMAGAYYQAYLVRQKGWTREHLGMGLRDSAIGICALGVMSLLVMVTAASVLHQNPDVTELNTAADVARQLQPLFRGGATTLFCLGIFAGAFSSFLVNAMIGGALLSDGLGRGGDMDRMWPKACTAAVMLIGMTVAIGVKSTDLNIGNLIIFAQAITVFVNPLLAGAMLWLAFQAGLIKNGSVPKWIALLAFAGFLLVLLLSTRTGYRLYLTVAQ